MEKMEKMEEKSKKYIVLVPASVVGEDVEKFMSGFLCKTCLYVFHPDDDLYVKYSSHYHFYIELFEPVDSFVIKDYFSDYSRVLIPKAKYSTIFSYLVHFGKFEVRSLDWNKWEEYRKQGEN